MKETSNGGKEEEEEDEGEGGGFLRRRISRREGESELSIVPPSFKKFLQQSECILVGQKLMHPSRLFFKLAEDLPPFLFEVPRVYGSDVDGMLRAIGVKDQPSDGDYAHFLQNLAEELGDSSELSVNELQGVIKVFDLLLGSPSLSGDFSSLSLFLPDSQCKLRPLRLCVVCDQPWLRQKVRENSVFFVHGLVSDFLVSSLQVPNLSDIVEEELVDEEGQVVNPTVALQQADSSLSQALTNKLHNPSLREAISYLLASSTKERLKEGSLSNQRQGEELDEQLRRMEVAVLHSLRTNVYMPLGSQSSRQRVKRKNITASTEGSPFFVSKSETYQGQSVLYLNGALLHSEVSPEALLSLALVYHFGLDASAMYPLSHLLERDAFSDSERIFSIFSSGQDITRYEESKRGRLGYPLQAKDQLSVELNPSKSFTAGEIVAIEKELPYVIEGGEGRLLEREEDEEGEGGGELSLFYAMVREVEDTSPLGVSSLRVQVSASEVRSMLSVDVFSFKSSDRREKEEKKGRGDYDSVSLIGRRREEEEEGGERKKDGEVSTSKTEKGSLSVDDVVSSISNVLRRHQINVLDTNQEELVAEVLRLRQEKEQVEVRMAELRTKASKAQDFLASLEDGFECSICFSNPIDRVLIPCGHQLCSSCDRGLRRRECPFCRVDITGSVPFIVPSFSIEEEEGV